MFEGVKANIRLPRITTQWYLMLLQHASSKQLSTCRVNHGKFIKSPTIFDNIDISTYFLKRADPKVIYKSIYNSNPFIFHSRRCLQKRMDHSKEQAHLSFTSRSSEQLFHDLNETFFTCNDNCPSIN